MNVSQLRDILDKYPPDTMVAFRYETFVVVEVQSAKPAEAMIDGELHNVLELGEV